MRITDLRVWPIVLECKPFTTSYGTLSQYRNVIVEIENDEGLVGVGEAAPGTPNENGETLETVTYVIEHFLKSILIGQDPRHPAVLRDSLDKVLAGHVVAKAAIDMAIYDLLGKISKMSIAELLGGRYRDKLPLIGAIGVKSIDEAAVDAKTWREIGASGIKMKVPSLMVESPSLMVERVRAVREQMSEDMTLIVDPNQGWISAGFARPIIDKISKYNVLVEQPILANDIMGLKTLSQTEVPIIADESVFTKQGLQSVIEHHAVSIINVKLTRPGGYGEASRFIHMAEGAGIRCQIDDVTSTRITTTAVAQLAASVRPETFFCYSVAPAHMWLYRDLVSTGGITIENGSVIIPKGPGLGLSIDHELLREATIITPCYDS